MPSTDTQWSLTLRQLCAAKCFPAEPHDISGSWTPGFIKNSC